MKHLLNSVNLIVSKYKEIEKITGEHYNIFSVMGMENSEVKTHSAIIGDLLNANGSHFMGDVFLKLFIETVQRQSESQKLKDFKFETEHSNCLVEEFKGKKNAEEITGGRIDLVIKDAKGEVIVIENKIFAPEQENQIQRYKNEYPDGMMLFLTLDGKDSVSAGNLVIDEDYHLICYKKTIINWLELCLKETFNQPILRETLKQYIVLIKKLTNQSTNKDMSEEIIKIMDENFEASAEIYKNFEKAIEKRQSEILTKILKTLNEETQGWKIELGFFKDSNCLFLNKENVQIRYRIKNSKHSVVNIEGINSLNEKLKSLGFDDSKMTKSPKYYWIQKDYHMDINALVNPQNKEGEITQLLKNIIKSFNQ